MSLVLVLSIYPNCYQIAHLSHFTQIAPCAVSTSHFLNDNCADPELFPVGVFEMFGVPALAGVFVHR